jgi:predicted nucleic acid-binding Zn ribbon protein
MVKRIKIKPDPYYEYVCEKCGYRFLTLEAARICEEEHSPKP